MFIACRRQYGNVITTNKKEELSVQFAAQVLILFPEMKTMTWGNSYK